MIKNIIKSVRIHTLIGILKQKMFSNAFISIQVIFIRLKYTHQWCDTIITIYSLITRPKFTHTNTYTLDFE